MGYKVQISDATKKLGYLRKGKVSPTPTYYNHPSAAIKARDSFVRKTEGKLICKILCWTSNREIDV